MPGCEKKIEQADVDGCSDDNSSHRPWLQSNSNLYLNMKNCFQTISQIQNY
jgi:hypothetical protein